MGNPKDTGAYAQQTQRHGGVRAADPKTRGPKDTGVYAQQTQRHGGVRAADPQRGIIAENDRVTD
eukprot:gene11326-13385_t